MTTIKFCGLTRPSDAAFAAELGASHVGAIFAESRRKVSEESAGEIFAAAGGGVKHVGVFGDLEADEIARVSDRLNLDVVQLHHPDEDITARLKAICRSEVWAVVGVDVDDSTFPGWLSASRNADALLLDTSVSGRTGGTGKPFDWDAAAVLLRRHIIGVPIVLAGGLRPSNVGEAIRILNPDVVDVSSGTETSPGIKDHNLMRSFAEAVHSASIV